MYLLRIAGIESELCSSDELNHAWNIVEIGGMQYHVDVTWDDPVWDVSGRVMHTYFLLSTQALKTVNNGRHSANDFNTAPVDTTYDNAFWQCSETAFQLVDGEIYYIDSDTDLLKAYDGTALCRMDGVWYADGGGYYGRNFSRLCTDGVHLYFSQPNAIYQYHLTTHETQLVYTPENTFGSWFYIYGFRYDDGNFICELNNSPNFNRTTKKSYTVTAAAITDTTVSELQIAHLPNKIGYTVGEKLDLTGLQVRAVFTDGLSGLITNYKVSGFDNKTPGRQTITVSIGTRTASFDVVVGKKQSGALSSSISWVYDPAQVLTITGTVPETHTLYVAEYDTNGRMIAILHWTADCSWSADEATETFNLFLLEDALQSFAGSGRITAATY